MVSSSGRCIALRCPDKSGRARADLMQPRDSVASRNSTFRPKPSGTYALGPKPLSTGCSIGAEGAPVKLYFSTFDQQDMHTFINNVDNSFLPACAFKNRPKTKSSAIRGAKLLLPIACCATESSSESALGRKSGSTRSPQDRQLSPSTQLSITVFSPYFALSTCLLGLSKTDY